MVVLVGDHLDALVEPESLEHLARLLAEPVSEEDVTAVIPVETVTAEAVGVTAVPRVLLGEHRPQAVLGKGRRAGETTRARAEDDCVVVTRGVPVLAHFNSLLAASPARTAAV